MSPRDSESLSCSRILKGVFQNVSSPHQDFAEAEKILPCDNIPLIENKDLEHIMRAQRLGSQIAGSRGARVARTFVYDWLILVLLVFIKFALHVMHPFYRYVGKDMMTDLKYPHKSDTVPFWAVPMLTTLLPMAIFVVIYVRRREIYDLHHAVLGLLYSVLVTAIITNAIKNAVGRPRPDFFWRCFPDGKDVYDALGNVMCHGEKHLLDDGHKSFPSGHTSWSFAGLGFLSLYLAGKIKAFDQRGHVAKLCIVFLPFLVACLVGISRVDDYRHHWQDVFAGGLLGMTIATFCYLQFFPPPNHSEGFFPYDCFHDVESHGSARTADACHPSNGQVVETQTGAGQHVVNGNRCLGLSLSRPSHPPLELEQQELGERGLLLD